VKFVLSYMLHMRSVTGMLYVVIALATIHLLAPFVQFTRNDMKILQNNIQSINTSLPLLRLTVQKLNIDVILPQEIWHPKEDGINIRNYTQRIVKVHNGNEGGGVAIITTRNVKKVHLKEYDTDGLEAVWADVKVGNICTVVGLVYIPPGDDNALCLLDQVTGKILQTHDHLMIGMDANARKVLWDDNCIGLDQYKKSI